MKNQYIEHNIFMEYIHNYFADLKRTHICCVILIFTKNIYQTIKLNAFNNKPIGDVQKTVVGGNF